MSNKQIWWLNINEVQRIKTGVLKYISSNHASKSRQKSSLSPSTPQTPLIKGKSQKVDKRQNVKDRKVKKSLNATFDEAQTRKQFTSSNNRTEKMPKGYYLDNQGKIFREPSHLGKVNGINKSEIEEIPDLILDSPKKDSQTPKDQTRNVSNEIPKSNIRLSKLSPEQIQILAYENIQALTLDIFSKEVVKVIPQKAVEKKNVQKQVQKIAQQKPVIVEQPKTFSVSQIAKMFGGRNMTKQKDNNQNEKWGIKANKPIKQETKNEDKKDKNQESMLSLVESTNPKINMNLNSSWIQRSQQPFAKQNKSQVVVKQYEKDKFSHSFLSKQSKQYITKNTKKQNVKQRSDETNYEFKRFSFTPNQSEALKKKYNLLSIRLDNLKSKVLQQEDQMPAAATERDYETRQKQHYIRESMFIYNKYSPLKALKTAIRKKGQEVQRQRAERESPINRKLQYYLRK